MVALFMPHGRMIRSGSLPTCQLKFLASGPAMQEMDESKERTAAVRPIRMRDGSQTGYFKVREQICASSIPSEIKWSTPRPIEKNSKTVLRTTRSGGLQSGCCCPTLCLSARYRAHNRVSRHLPLHAASLPTVLVPANFQSVVRQSQQLHF